MTVVQGLWIGDRLSPLERACAQSFLRYGHEFHLYTYGPLDNVPPGCRLFDAAEILAAEEIFEHGDGVAKGSLATFSNLFRFELLHRRGGWWMDMDVFCLTPTLPDEGIVIGRQDESLINDAVMRFPSGHELMRSALEIARRRGRAVEWAEIGPVLVTRLIEGSDYEQAVFPTPVFYPIHFSQFWAVLDPRRTAHAAELIRSSATLHLWNEMWRRAGLDKNILPPEGSLLRSLYEWSIGADEFDSEYVLAADCPNDGLKLQTVARQK